MGLNSLGNLLSIPGKDKKRSKNFTVEDLHKLVVLSLSEEHQITSKKEIMN